MKGLNMPVEQSLIKSEERRNQVPVEDFESEEGWHEVLNI